jgi:hypothetical protein
MLLWPVAAISTKNNLMPSPAPGFDTLEQVLTVVCTLRQSEASANAVN